MSAYLLGTLILLPGISLVSCEANATATTTTTTTTTIKPENLKLVDVIKEDLRKNNDDYAEHLPRLGAPRSAYLNITMKPPSAAGPARRPPARPQHELEDTRRRFNAHRGHKAKLFKDNMIANARLRSRIQNEAGPSQMVSPDERLKLQNLLKHNYPKKYMFKDKPDKLKMFIQKNKGKLQQLVEKKKEEAMMMKAHVTESTTPGELSSVEKVHEPLKLPTADQLDMAPAQGGRVHAMRMKGHLCFRNVMIPEGPKYDSKGKVYLEAFGADRKRYRLYHETKPPAILLPRCCNCCTKSVLGCE